ncbi:hypothetical protein ACMC56_16050 [Campylobacterota bacterium DY0563]
MNDPIKFIDPQGLEVYLCKAPVNGVNIVDHHWIKTDTVERGMWNDNDTKEWYDDVPFFADVAIRDESYKGDAMCQLQNNIDENKVNNQLQNYRDLGTWTPWNQCQSTAANILNNARTNKTPYNRNKPRKQNPWVKRYTID